MKNLLSLLLFFTTHGMAQIKKEIDAPTTYIVAQLSTGYVLNNYADAALQLGLKSHHIYSSINLIISYPKMATFNVGYDINIKNANGGDLLAIQPFILEGAQWIGGEEHWRYKDTPKDIKDGFYSGYGISIYIRKWPLSFTLQQLGKYTNANVGIYVTF